MMCRPYPILVLVILAFLYACGAALGSYARDPRISRIDSFVVREMADGRIPGVSIGIVEDGKAFYLKGYGTADGSGRAVTPDTPFPLGSVGKTFTGLAIRQLIAEGKVESDASVVRYIPFFRTADGSDAWSSITIGHLLGHRSGFSKAQGGANGLYDTTKSSEDLVRSLRDLKLAHMPGAVQDYSNINFILLGLVVERVSGVAYADYIEKRVFGPLGFRDSHTDQGKAVEDGMTEGHWILFGRPFPHNPDMPKGQMAAGFLISSSRDMVRYMRAYLNNGYLDGRSIIPDNPLRPRKPGNGLETPYYGVYWEPTSSYPIEYRGSFCHVGSWVNNHATMMVIPGSRTAIVVLTNVLNGIHGIPGKNSITITNGIADIMAGSEPPANGDMGFGRRYAIMNALTLLLLAVSVYRFIGAWRFKGLDPTDRDGFVSGVSGIVFLDLAVSILLLANSMALFPDYGIPAIAVGIALMASAAIRISRNRRRNRWVSNKPDGIDKR